MSSSKTILVVDDSRVSRMMTSKFIQSHSSEWEIIEAGTGDEAIEKMKVVSPALVIMDINMPGISGTEAAEILRGKYPQLKIALQTANIQEAMRKRAEIIGADFLEKPINERRIHQLLIETEAR